MLDRSATSRKLVYDAIERAYEKLGYDNQRLGQFLVNAVTHGPLFYVENGDLANMINKYADWSLRQR